jgi:hypothetical protein
MKTGRSAIRKVPNPAQRHAIRNQDFGSLSFLATRLVRWDTQATDAPIQGVIIDHVTINRLLHRMLRHSDSVRNAGREEHTALIEDQPVNLQVKERDGRITVTDVSLHMVMLVPAQVHVIIHTRTDILIQTPLVPASKEFAIRTPQFRG